MTKSIIVAACLGLILTGCTTPLGQKLNTAVAERVDFGDGLVFDVMPVSLGSAALDKYAPGSGAVVDLLESKLKAKRDAKLGPFNGLPYTTQRQVVLKTGVIISEAEIARIVEVLTPVVPSAIVREVEPAKFSTQPATVAPEVPADPPPAGQGDDVPVVTDRPSFGNI